MRFICNVITKVLLQYKILLTQEWLRTVPNPNPIKYEFTKVGPKLNVAFTLLDLKPWNFGLGKLKQVISKQFCWYAEQPRSAVSFQLTSTKGNANVRFQHFPNIWLCCGYINAVLQSFALSRVLCLTTSLYCDTHRTYVSFAIAKLKFISLL